MTPTTSASDWEQEEGSPLPTPEELREYEDLVPGSANKILEQIEESSKQEQRIREQYELMREMIHHENSLINHRITWLVTVQGFLFCGAVFADPWFAKIAIVALGIGLTLVTTIGVIASFRAQRILSRQVQQHLSKLPGIIHIEGKAP